MSSEKGLNRAPFWDSNLSPSVSPQKRKIGSRGKLISLQPILGGSRHTGPSRTSGGSILGSGDPLGERRALRSASLGLQPIGELRRIVPAALRVACENEKTCEAIPAGQQRVRTPHGNRPQPGLGKDQAPQPIRRAHPASHTAPPSPLPHGQRGITSFPGRPHPADWDTPPKGQVSWNPPGWTIQER